VKIILNSSNQEARKFEIYKLVGQKTRNLNSNFKDAISSSLDFHKDFFGAI